MVRLKRGGPVLLIGLIALAATFVAGCDTPSAHTFSRNYGLRPDVPVDPPKSTGHYEDDRAEGGRLFKLYCGSCHNARPLGERPFNNYSVAIAHMRDQAYLTGKEYRQIILFLRRWDDVGPPTPPVEAAPKRFTASQPISELRGKFSAAGAGAPPPPGAANGAFNPAARDPAEPGEQLQGPGPEAQPGGARIPGPRPAPAELPAPID
jgi:hypothetical protein